MEISLSVGVLLVITTLFTFALLLYTAFKLMVEIVSGRFWQEMARTYRDKYIQSESDLELAKVRFAELEDRCNDLESALKDEGESWKLGNDDNEDYLDGSNA